MLAYDQRLSYLPSHVRYCDKNFRSRCLDHFSFEHNFSNNTPQLCLVAVIWFVQLIVWTWAKSSVALANTMNFRRQYSEKVTTKITNSLNFLAVFMVTTEATRGRPIVLVFASVDYLLIGFVSKAYQALLGCLALWWTSVTTAFPTFVIDALLFRTSLIIIIIIIADNKSFQRSWPAHQQV